MPRLFVVVVLTVFEMVTLLFFTPFLSVAQDTDISKVSNAEVRMHLGSPTMFVDGKPTAAMTYTVGGNRKEKFFRDFGKVGVNFVSFGVSPTTARVWKGPDEYDFTSIDEIMNRVVENHSNALIFPRVWLFSPPW